MYNEYKSNKEETENFVKQRLKEERRAMEDRQDAIVRKQEKNSQAVAELHKKQQHEIMLKQEERRLRAEDTLKQKERSNRLNMKLKIKIIEQYQSHAEAYLTFKNRQNLQIQTSVQTQLQNLMAKQHLENELSEWA